MKISVDDVAQFTYVYSGQLALFGINHHKIFFV